MKPTDFATLLNKYFIGYLTNERNLSANTISSYRDTFSQFICYCKSQENLPPEKLTIISLTPELLARFLATLESEGKSIATRNQRLAALKAFFKYVQLVMPEHMVTMQRLLSIKEKKRPKATVNFLTVEGIACLLKQPSAQTTNGYRDMLLLTVLYDSGARVSELTEIKIGDIRLEHPATIRLHGKGDKARIVPISPNTAGLIKNYLTRNRLDLPHFSAELLFQSRAHQKLTRSGILYIVQKYASMARTQAAGLIPDKLTPHSIRHSKAMHLLQAGVNLVYIRDFLGHEYLKTTEVYARSDSRAKREAISKAYSHHSDDVGFGKLWTEDDNLMAWLKQL